MMFCNIENSKAIFKTHLKWTALTLSPKYKKFIFQTSVRNSFFGKLFSSNYKKLFSSFQVSETFSRKYKKWFLQAWTIALFG